MSKIFSLEELLSMSPKAFVNKCFLGGKTGKPAWNSGKKMSDEIRKKISDAQKGINRVSFEKRSMAQKGRKFTDQHRMNISKARKGKRGLNGDNPRARPVGCPAGQFRSLKEAAQAMNCDGGTMRSRITKGWPGYRWL